jgi:hypothetical protein
MPVRLKTNPHPHGVTISAVRSAERPASGKIKRMKRGAAREQARIFACSAL